VKTIGALDLAFDPLNNKLTARRLYTRFALLNSKSIFVTENEHRKLMGSRGWPRLLPKTKAGALPFSRSLREGRGPLSRQAQLGLRAGRPLRQNVT
jgi:hypothetical protein